jgi:hypothetical protein
MRGVALAAHGHAFDEILSPRAVWRRARFFASTLRWLALGTSQGYVIREQGENDEYGKRKDNKE